MKTTVANRSLAFRIFQFLGKILDIFSRKKTMSIRAELSDDAEATREPDPPEDAFAAVMAEISPPLIAPEWTKNKARVGEISPTNYARTGGGRDNPIPTSFKSYMVIPLFSPADLACPDSRTIKVSINTDGCGELVTEDTLTIAMLDPAEVDAPTLEEILHESKAGEYPFYTIASVEEAGYDSFVEDVSTGKFIRINHGRKKTMSDLGFSILSQV